MTSAFCQLQPGWRGRVDVVARRSEGQDLGKTRGFGDGLGAVRFGAVRLGVLSLGEYIQHRSAIHRVRRYDRPAACLYKVASIQLSASGVDTTFSKSQPPTPLRQRLQRCRSSWAFLASGGVVRAGCDIEVIRISGQLCNVR
jgi:hypothetical protein